MSSTRTMKAPPFERAISQANRAHAADPRCKSPVGDGANRPRYMSSSLATLERDETRDVLPFRLEQDRTPRGRRGDLFWDVGRPRNGRAVDLEDDVPRLELAV